MSDARDQARAQYESVRELVEREDHDAIHEDALSVQVRSAWEQPGTKLEPYEYEILLCTGGPAVRIIGTLNEHAEPDSAKLQYQDWFTGWETYHEAEEEILLAYSRAFWFGT